VIDSNLQEPGRPSTPFTQSPLSARAVQPTHVPAANLTYAYAGFGAVLGILFGVATAVTLHQTTQTAQQKPVMAAPQVQAPVHEASVVHAGFAAPEEKDMGSVSSLTSGLRGHLTTSWSEKLSYKFVVGPSDPSQHEAFADTVSNPPHPVSIDVQLRSAAGAALCDQEVVLKYDPSKKPGQTPAQLNKQQAQELDREHSNDIFQKDLGKDGQIESISSHGTMPCSKQDYDTAAFWSFNPNFPDLGEQARLLKKIQNERALAKTTAPRLPLAAKAPAIATASAATMMVPAAKPVLVAAAAAPAKTPVAGETISVPKTTDLLTIAQKPTSFHFEVEGDDEIVDFDAAQRSLLTSEGKTFYVSETLVASSVAGWLDAQANVHYRCDETSNCTLSLASATVLHATLRNHHNTLAQSETLSMNAVPASQDGPAGPDSLGR
jgi:hypothetical protein